MKSLRIGLPSKGRLAEQSAELLSQAGLSFRRQERSLFARVSEMPVELTFLRTEDIPVLCGEGAIDLGITGSDLIAEAGVELTPRLSLGIGKCRLSVCLPEEFAFPQDLHGKRVATSFPRITDDSPSITRVHPSRCRVRSRSWCRWDRRRDCRSRGDRLDAGRESAAGLDRHRSVQA